MNAPEPALHATLELAPDFAAWPLAEAARHRAVVAHAGGRAWLAAEAEPAPELLEAVEARLGVPLAAARIDATTLEAWLAAADANGRALDHEIGHEAGRGAGAGGADASAGDRGAAAPDELSLRTLGRQGSAATRLLDALVYDALKDGASDLHFERDEQGAAVRVRIDGVMQPLSRVAGVALADQVVSRLKVMAELDIGERRLPQDGRFRLRAFGREIDFRLSIMPGSHGEDAVIRVLDRRGGGLLEAGGAPSLAALGFGAELTRQLHALASEPHGMLLVTGPTGSGKTSTLYAMLAESTHGHDKLITIEDPVEYALAGAVQIPVNERKGLSFARGLRSILRHDPDRILVGEIRDGETAQIAVQAALTGHLVFSTVHANHALDVLARLVHLGLDPYHLVSALNAVLGQRLVRRLCQACAVPVEAGPGGHPGERRAVGCPACRGTGYRGRLAIAELLLLDENLRDLIAARAPMAQLRRAALAAGARPLAEAAAAAVQSGLTSADEVRRVLGGARAA